MNREEFEAHIKSMAHVATFEEVKSYWDKEVEKEENHWGKKDFWAKMARKARDGALKAYQEGKPVRFYREYDHFGYGWYGEDVTAELYSDGTFSFEYHSSD